MVVFVFSPENTWSNAVESISGFPYNNENCIEVVLFFMKFFESFRKDKNTGSSLSMPTAAEAQRRTPCQNSANLAASEWPSLLYGAVIGDVIGSKYEFNNIKTKDFPLFSEGCGYTAVRILERRIPVRGVHPKLCDQGHQ